MFHAPVIPADYTHVSTYLSLPTSPCLGRLGRPLPLLQSSIRDNTWLLYIFSSLFSLASVTVCHQDLHEHRGNKVDVYCLALILSSLDTACLHTHSGLCRREMFPSYRSRSSASVGTHVLNVYAHAESLSKSEFNRNQYTYYDVEWMTRRVVGDHR